MTSSGSRLLIAVGETAADVENLPDGVRALIDSADQVLVLSPRLPSRLEWLASATDKAKEEADDRLREVLGQLEELGTEAGGENGADDPLLAFEDAAARFEPSHILVGLRDEDRAGWQERGLLSGLFDRFHIPITIFELPPERS
jgi:hypothetical protein